MGDKFDILKPWQNVTNKYAADFRTFLNNGGAGSEAAFEQVNSYIAPLMKETFEFVKNLKDKTALTDTSVSATVNLVGLNDPDCATYLMFRMYVTSSEGEILHIEESFFVVQRRKEKVMA